MLLNIVATGLSLVTVHAFASNATDTFLVTNCLDENIQTTVSYKKLVGEKQFDVKQIDLSPVSSQQLTSTSQLDANAARVVFQANADNLVPTYELPLRTIGGNVDVRLAHVGIVNTEDNGIHWRRLRNFDIKNMGISIDPSDALSVCEALEVYGY